MSSVAERAEGRDRSDGPRLLRTALAALLTRGALLPVALLQGALLARGLGPAGLGQYSAALLDVNLAVAILSLGLPGGLAVVAGQARAQAGRAQGHRMLAALQRAALRHGLWITVAVATLWALTRVPGLPVATWLGRPPGVLSIVAGMVILQFARDVHNSLLWGGQRFAAQNRINVAVQLLLSIALATLWAQGALSAAAALGLQLCGHAVWIAGARWAARQIVEPSLASIATGADADLGERAGGGPADGESDDAAARARRMGLRNYVGVLLELLLFRIDVYLIEKLLPAARMASDLGLYQAGVRIAELVLLVPSTLNAVLFAKAAAREQVAAATVRSAKLALWVGLAALAGMALCGRPLLVLFFGARFGGSFAPCLWVLAGCVATCFSGPLAGTLSGDRGYPHSILWAQAVALLVNVGANLFLLPRHGIVGAAMASTVAYAVSALWISTAFARRYGLSMWTLLRPEWPWTLWRTLAAPEA